MQLTFRPLRFCLPLAGLLVALLSGCGNDNTTSSENKTPPAPGGSATTAGTSKTGSEMSTEDFIKKAAEGNMAEVQLGELAKSHASNPEAKQFAQLMIDDHSKNLEQVRQLAQKKNVALASAPGREEQNQKAELEKLSGAEFDQAYAKLMLNDHSKDVAEFEGVANSSKDADVKNYAEQTLPTLRHHLKMAQDFNEHVKALASEKPGEQPIQTRKETEPQPAR